MWSLIKVQDSQISDYWSILVICVPIKKMGGVQSTTDTCEANTMGVCLQMQPGDYSDGSACQTWSQPLQLYPGNEMYSQQSLSVPLDNYGYWYWYCNRPSSGHGERSRFDSSDTGPLSLCVTYENSDNQGTITWYKAPCNQLSS